MAQRRSGSTISVGVVRAQIGRWRARRVKRGPMPSGLWEAAVSLAREQGVARIARVLNVDYGALKRRVTASGEAAREGASGFMTFDPASLLGRTEPVGTVVEWSAADGSKLVVRLTAHDRLDFERLAVAFWRRSS